ncbi:flagellar biosynthesis protein [Paenibacillus sp. CAA11]|uniref:TIGR02530 family flagellar biosynthesis protein n=1 Tax=Paenibacillus sp. CAA11 TaxID=1532905 RepID=UPI000D34F4D1|nr:TIGR02530 family flagellar biosynthesis protein [Paenibacillus sp. CAA11]AWB44300.1 flagellar biosynthesis protein [Paenibacillus sp. CAA11]
MSESISIGSIYPGRIQSSLPPQRATKQDLTPTPGSSFKEALQDSLVKISNHAAKRLEQRGIQLRPEQLGKIGRAIDNAAEKGAKDSLILMKDIALIVNINNRTVVTAMDGSSMKNNVFTQIDSAVII